VTHFFSNFSGFSSFGGFAGFAERCVAAKAAMLAPGDPAVHASSSQLYSFLFDMSSAVIRAPKKGMEGKETKIVGPAIVCG
jgi:hypothetical protein